jgi:hypothetical protein
MVRGNALGVTPEQFESTWRRLRFMQAFYWFVRRCRFRNESFAGMLSAEQAPDGATQSSRILGDLPSRIDVRLLISWTMQHLWHGRLRHRVRHD